VLQRGSGALLDMRIFGTRPFVVSSLVMTVVAVNGFGTLIVLPLILTAVTGLNTFALGLFMVPGVAIIAAVSALGGRVYDRYGPRPLVIPGALIWTASFWLLTRIDEGTSVWTILAIYLVQSGSQALMWGPVTTTALASLRTELQPHGSAAFGTIQQLAGAAGGAILVSAYTIGADASHTRALTQAQAVSAGQTAFATAAVIAVAAILGTLFVGKNRSTEAEHS
jgi:DHA2 family lincomycin resistance protein-like MFS transporter